MKYFFISLSLLLLVGCQKETTVNEMVETNSSTQVQRGLLDELSYAIQNPTQSRLSGPANPNNPFDHVGDYQRSVLLEMNDMQSGPEAARNRAEYLQQLNTLISENAEPVLETDGAPEPIEKDVYSSALAVFTGAYSTDQKVSIFISMENTIRASNSLGSDSKERLLSLISSFKYVAYTLGNEGILFNGDLMLPGAWWDCWDQQFSHHVGQNMSNALWSWEESPFETALSWIGLGGTILVSVADGAIQASNDC